MNFSMISFCRSCTSISCSVKPPMRSFNISRSFSVELVSAIYVVAPDKSSGKRVQHLHIKCDGPGFITLNELMKKETARTQSRRPLKTYGFQRF